ncbi:MAG TPA: NAD-dependent epimerase/dehydratase family protein [Pirellulales bacterium]|nr:NAD-dependent epimerase/dehydratase family protein [Pirellulales bacterium]
MHIFMTGVCGFVGSSLALALRERLPDVTVSGIDNFIRPGSETNLARLRAAGVRVDHRDIRNDSDFETLPRCDWIIDAAANPTVLAGVDGRTSSRQLVEHNLVGTVNVLEYARRSNAGLVLLSTSRVYSIGALVKVPLRVADGGFLFDANQSAPPGCSAAGIAEDFSTTAPISLYGATKLASEALALEYGQTFKFPVVVNRCGVLAGEGQFGVAEQGIFSFWVRAYALKRPLKYIGFEGTGHQVRDALHPADLTDLVLRQIQAPDRSAGNIWNVGGGATNAMSLAQLSRWCAAEFGEHPIEAMREPRPFDVPWVVMDSRRVAAQFQWSPRIALPQILEQIAAHHRQHPEWFLLSQPR